MQQRRKEEKNAERRRPDWQREIPGSFGHVYIRQTFKLENKSFPGLVFLKLSFSVVLCSLPQLNTLEGHPVCVHPHPVHVCTSTGIQSIGEMIACATVFNDPAMSGSRYPSQAILWGSALVLFEPDRQSRAKNTTVSIQALFKGGEHRNMSSSERTWWFRCVCAFILSQNFDFQQVYGN